MTLYTWVRKWLRLYKKIHVKPSTYDSYVTYASHVDCMTELSELTVDDIQILINNMVEDGLKLSTIKHMLTIVRQALKKAKSLGYIKSLSMLEDIEVPSDDSIVIRPLRAQQIDLLLKSSKSSFYSDVYRFLLFTGCRVGELIALRWSDIDFFNSEIHIRNTDYKGTIQSVKTKHGRRIIPMYGDVYKIIHARYGEQEKHDRVFLNTLGQPIKYRTLLDNWHWFCGQIGIFENIGFHVLRHTFVHLALRNGIPAKIVSAWVGHSDVAFTLRVYDCVDGHDFEIMSGKLRQLFEQKNNAHSSVVAGV